MIVYDKDKASFLADVRANRIDNEILDRFQRRLRRVPARNEVESWRNSMMYMSQQVAHSGIAEDAGVAIEFTIPLSSKRVDFILSGRDAAGHGTAVIVELKQWSEVRETEMDGVVRTALGGGLRDVLHPSYQAWSYAELIFHYNKTIRDQGISLHPCAYLHNLDDPTALCDRRYAQHLEKAPAFLRRDADRLGEYLSEHIRSGDDQHIIERIERGEIRPSKMLAESLEGMLRGKPEFVLIDEQKLVFEAALLMASRAQTGRKQVLLVEGGPGTGKSVVAINLLAELTRRGLSTQYVSRNAAPRSVYSTKLKGTMRRGVIDNLFRGSGTFTSADPDAMDALLVDEAHRLTEKSGLYGNRGENQLRELIRASKCSVFFLDEDQRVTLQDIGSKEQVLREAADATAEVREMQLASQFRCMGSDGYLAFVDHVLDIRETANPELSAGEYDWRVFDDPNALWAAIRRRNRRNSARLVAGYCWDWKSKKDRAAMDIVLDDFDFEARWNLDKDGSLWLIAENSIEEVGCIHTCQGLELDYVGVIVGPDLVVRDGAVVTDGFARATYDRSIRGFKKMRKVDAEDADRRADEIIKNTYRTLMTRGLKGCYVFSPDAETREYLRSFARESADPSDDAPPDSAPPDHPFQGLALPEVPAERLRPFENALPVYELAVAAGDFGAAQPPPEASWVEVPDFVRPARGMFIAQVFGESMNRRVPNGSWCLFRHRPTGSRDGRVLLLRHRDSLDPETGERFTLKIYRSEKVAGEDGRSKNVRVRLVPDSTDSGFEPIEVPASEVSAIDVVAEFLAVVS